MKKNLGTIDKTIRICLGSIIIILGAYLNSVWGVLGMIPIITTQIGICPFYLLFGINTIQKTKKV